MESLLPPKQHIKIAMHKCARKLEREDAYEDLVLSFIELDKFLRSKDNLQDMWISFKNIEWISETGKTIMNIINIEIDDMDY